MMEKKAQAGSSLIHSVAFPPYILPLLCLHLWSSGHHGLGGGGSPFLVDFVVLSRDQFSRGPVVASAEQLLSWSPRFTSWTWIQPGCDSGVPFIVPHLCSLCSFSLLPVAPTALHTYPQPQSSLPCPLFSLLWKIFFTPTLPPNHWPNCSRS